MRVFELYAFLNVIIEEIKKGMPIMNNISAIITNMGYGMMFI
jgi:hypothetical protein